MTLLLAIRDGCMVAVSVLASGLLFSWVNGTEYTELDFIAVLAIVTLLLSRLDHYERKR